MTEASADAGALLALLLPSRPEAAGAARRALAALNGDLALISQSRLADAELLVTELVTNAVRHGDTETVSVAVRATAEALRVEVGQASLAPLIKREAPPSLERPGGWGLPIVDVLAHAWGIDGDETRVVVWFEIDRPRSPTPIEPTGEAQPPGEITGPGQP